VSEYENAKRVIRQMRLGRTQAQDVAARAFEADLKTGRPDIALKCAKEFKLPDDYVTRAATALFGELIKRKMFPKALEIARSYNLAHGGAEAQDLLTRAATLDDDPQGSIAGIRRLTESARGRAETTEADSAIELLKQARRGRDKDPRVRGRAVLLPAEGEVWLTGDLHGNVDNLKRFAAMADLASHPERILVIQEIVHARFITADNRDLSFVAIMEAIRLMAAFPGRIYYLLGNHDLAVHLDRELVKGGKYLNRYLYRGMAYMYRERWQDVLLEYRKFITGMPAAVFAPNGIFMAHSTPKKAFIPTLSRDFLYEADPRKTPLRKLKPIAALVNGREYGPDAADMFADQLEVDLLLCGHTPTNKGFKVPNHRHLILDSQHEKARYVRFDLSRRYVSAQELAGEVGLLDPNAETAEVTGELM
jgi:hypothetical protein